MTTSFQAPQCTSGRNGSCQFASHQTVHLYEGRHYCPVHAPIGDPQGIAGEPLASFIRTELDNKRRDFYGIVVRSQSKFSYEFRGNVDMEGCTFDHGVQVTFYNKTNISDSRAIGKCKIFIYGSLLICQRGHFESVAEFHLQNPTVIDLQKTSFSRQPDFYNIDKASKLDFSECEFSFPPRLKQSDELPEIVNFRGARFVGKEAFTGDAFARFRIIRNLFHKQRDRTQEGIFFAYEQRAMRRSLGGKIKVWLPRLFSAVYDYVALYGQSYERAFYSLCALQVVAGFIYSISSRRFYLGGDFDWEVASFTLTQAVRPFALFAASWSQAWPYGHVVKPPPGFWWLAGTAIHTILTLALLSLFLLALRWRFRRD